MMLARCFLAIPLVLCACVADPTPAPDPAERWPGGGATNSLLLGKNAFTRPADNLSEVEQRAFFTGNSLFNESWVAAPASTTARDGLGPTFNARSCSGCHFKDGRGRPDVDQGGLGLLLRLGGAGLDDHGAPIPDSALGGQLQDQALPNVVQEGRVVIRYQEQAGTYEDGTEYSLRAPTYAIESTTFELSATLGISPRVAPAMIGMGLLEAIPEARLLSLTDPDDSDGDGISGRINRVYDVDTQAMVVGRFGWKAEQPSVRQQTAAAFLGDMGITSPLFPQENCPAPQQSCKEAQSGGSPEIDGDLLDKVTLYSRVLAVPVRRNPDAPQVQQGRGLFAELGCDGCHVRGHETGMVDIAALSQQRIWPYTDLLLHDMGEALADDGPIFSASAREWRTPPLWGLGLTQEVNGHLFLMHDGRARGFAEAILWHGGEAQDATDAFRALPKADRAALLAFLESL